MYIQTAFKENVEFQKFIVFVEKVGLLSSGDFIVMAQRVGDSSPSVWSMKYSQTIYHEP